MSTSQIEEVLQNCFILGKQKTLHKITMISTTTITTTTTTALHNAATRKLQLQLNLQLHTIQPQLQSTT